MDKNKNSVELKSGLDTLAFYNVAFVVSDVNKAIEWYGTVLGFKLIMKESIPVKTGKLEMAFMEGAGLKIEMLQNSESQYMAELEKDSRTDAPPSIIGNKAIVFQVEDLETATMWLEKKGVDFLWKERYLAEGALFCSMILDPDGNRINIFQSNTVL